MNPFKYISLLFVTMLGSLFVSCEETAEIDEYANWQELGEAFIDSIANIAEANADGRWLKILSFKLSETDINGYPAEYDNDYYIYCHIEAEGTGTWHPLYTDLVSVNYRGRLIPSISYPEGKIFDESYKGAFNPAQAVPRNFSMGDLITGWTTALMRMVKGDTWRVYIPAKLGYNTTEKDNIPAYSTLIFDMNLEGFSSEPEE